MCQCAWDNRDSPKGEKGIFPMFLSRVALGRTYGGLNAGRSDEPPVVPDFGQRFKVVGGVFNKKAVEGGPGGTSRLFRKALDVQSKGWTKKKKGTMPVSVIGAGCGIGIYSTQSDVNKGGCKKDPERDNDGLEFVVYDGTQAYMQYILLYRRVAKRGAENKLEWNLPITVDGPEVIVVMDPLELSEVFVIGGKVKRKRVLAKYEDIDNVPSLVLPGGYVPWGSTRRTTSRRSSPSAWITSTAARGECRRSWRHPVCCPIAPPKDSTTGSTCIADEVRNVFLPVERVRPRTHAHG